MNPRRLHSDTIFSMSTFCLGSAIRGTVFGMRRGMSRERQRGSGNARVRFKLVGRGGSEGTSKASLSPRDGGAGREPERGVFRTPNLNLNRNRIGLRLRVRHCHPRRRK